jgi:hypothetical protein
VPTPRDWNAWADLFTEDALYVEVQYGTFPRPRRDPRWITQTMANVPDMYFPPIHWHMIDGDRVCFLARQRPAGPRGGPPIAFPSLTVLQYRDGLWCYELDVYDVRQSERANSASATPAPHPAERPSRSGLSIVQPTLGAPRGHVDRAPRPPRRNRPRRLSCACTRASFRSRAANSLIALRAGAGGAVTRRPIQQSAGIAQPARHTARQPLPAHSGGWHLRHRRSRSRRRGRSSRRVDPGRRTRPMALIMRHAHRHHALARTAAAVFREKSIA